MYWEFNEKQNPIQAIRKNDWKLKREPELYNLSNDVSKSEYLALKKSEELKEMLELLKSVRTEHSLFPLTTKEIAYKKQKKN